ncbi:natural resistance-associated macrophage protein-domain-containing protein [Cyathus striatus]|nr:natural resistance-associated macrophage protein-domain-containing protein [Cyathus striatus]
MSYNQSYPATNQLDVPPSPAKPTSKMRSAMNAVFVHLKNHVGMGIICSVAYFDPGNWSVDLQAGSDFGYRPMLFVILLAGLGAIVVQTLACKLGVVTGLDLASHCRLLLHDRPRHTRLIRYVVLYPLYVLAEVAIIATDLAELLGSAIGFCLLFPQLPLWAGVILTAADVLIFLFFSDPKKNKGRPVKIFEYTIITLVMAVFGCFIALLVKGKPNWGQAFMGFIPSKGLFQSEPNAIYAAIGILGATVMPHALFLGSSLATQDRVSTVPLEEEEVLPGPIVRPSGNIVVRAVKWFLGYFTVDRADRENGDKDYRSKHGERENNSYTFVKQHLVHGIIDVISSLVTFAIPINSAILILAASVFFKPGESGAPAGLFEAFDLIKEKLGKPAALIFAIALLSAGQTSSITVTLAGQIVSEGFIEWKVSPMLRRLLTRSISLVPSVIVAVAVGKDGISSLLVASQVLLSIVLPFVLFPLVYLTSSEKVMRIRKPTASSKASLDDSVSIHEHSRPANEISVVLRPHLAHKESVEKGLEEKIETATISVTPYGSDEFIDYSNSRWLRYLSYAIWCVVLCANVYAIVMLFLQ